MHAGLADGQSRAIDQQRDRDQPRTSGPLAKAGGEPEVAGSKNAIARDRQGSEAYALQAMDTFIEETFSNISATHEGNLQRFNDMVRAVGAFPKHTKPRARARTHARTHTHRISRRSMHRRAAFTYARSHAHTPTQLPVYIHRYKRHTMLLAP